MISIPLLRSGFQKKLDITVHDILCFTQCMPHSTNDELFENLRLELRRGCLVLAVLSALRREQYGYTLRKALVEQGMGIDEGTLYPLLRRLESQGLLASEWREQDKRNKRFYRLSPEGESMLKLLRNDSLRRTMGRAGRRWVHENFTWDRVAQRMYECYSNLCGIGNATVGFPHFQNRHRNQALDSRSAR